jgi:hypothetical protein
MAILLVTKKLSLKIKIQLHKGRHLFLDKAKKFLKTAFTPIHPSIHPSRAALVNQRSKKF